MIKVEKEQKGAVLVARLSGTLEEGTDLDALIGKPPGELHVHCSGVTRLNSTGAKAWTSYFGKVTADSKVRFFECSTAIVEQLNMIRSFVGSGTVESVLVPLLCAKCGAEQTRPFTAAEAKAQLGGIAGIPCKCGGQATFDDYPEEYFHFLTRR
jgi:hypothetical protein